MTKMLAVLDTAQVIDVALLILKMVLYFGVPVGLLLLAIWLINRHGRR